MDKCEFHQSALNITQQISLLKQRGLTIADEDIVRSCLASVSFHRLSAYFPPYETNNQQHTFRQNIRFQHIWNLYVFDRELRLLVLDVLERIEVALRAAISNHMATEYDPWWYLNDSLFKSGWIKPLLKRSSTPKDNFFAELNILRRNRNQNEEIKRYFKQHDTPEYPPDWIILECLPFGKCTNLFRYLRSHNDKSSISTVFGVHHKVFESALEPLRYTRNLCAHHARLWDRWFVYKPRNLQEMKKINCQPGTLKQQMILFNLFLQKLSPHSSWKDRLYDLFARYEEFIRFESMGFNSKWADDPFWKND